MHKNSLLRMQWFKYYYIGDATGLRVLDIGSMDVNGSYKDTFKDFDYVGADIAPGDNVDIILDNPYYWDIETDSFDIVISGQAFEHTEFFWVTISEMTRVLKKGGLMCIIAPHGFEEHRYPVDCYRFFSDGMVAMARYVSLTVLHSHTNCSPKGQKWFSKKSADSMLVARKDYSGKAKIVDIKNYKLQVPDQKKLIGDLVSYKKSFKDKLFEKIEKLIL